MATIALPRPIPPHRTSSAVGSVSSISLESISAAQQAPVPNKHLPVCPPGPVPAEEPNTPPPSPPRDDEQIQQSSLLFPPGKFDRHELGSVAVYNISPADVAAAVDYTSRQPLPDPNQVFPWFHGLHPHNHIQQAFFIARHRSLRKTPTCVRGVTLVKADGDVAVARLKGAIAPQEFMHLSASAEFIDVDPRDGFCVRNFQIQAAKAAMISDIIVYGDDEAKVRKLAIDIATAQSRWRHRHESQGHSIPEYNTFLCISPFDEFEKNHQEIVAIDGEGQLTGNVLDFFHQERKEMYHMTKASEISHNVWLGPTPDPTTQEEDYYDILIECSDVGRLNPSTLRTLAESKIEPAQRPYIDFPSSGSILPPTWSQAEADGILETCKWIYHLAHGTLPACEKSSFDFDGDLDMDEQPEQEPVNIRPRKILVHCADGYTESTMLGIAYFSYSTGRGIADAWLHLHTLKQRNFFAYPTDVALLTCIEARLLHESPLHAGKCLREVTALIKEPAWLPGLDGSLPSRVLDYMYLGNLGHANNPDLLRALGISQILSVGETSMWKEGQLELWGAENVCVVQGVQDNGIDPLRDEFERCLEFIGEFLFLFGSMENANFLTDRGRRNGTATLVHCRVGVSRSATICIAEVMRALDLSFPRAYCFVRARRLNVIIQPHLRFAYELLKWEELNQVKKHGSSGIKRELEWGEIAREIALMNRPYAR
ncbi:pps1 dual specificty phosphatase [Colletotrichum karsti]|uniref:Pps1 dual specificty phosphatase n=1 Tax=Colletotrichum karsti TaxID=1095194 RepID=A0A9P6HY92_9PEZI|nr:pps1 dual specificty phosphatase [Colletotrichum karsti]KAF9870546.1 pps1 dual specificty phosphatase [Colletotrichum karsti]